jgi:hypothetical protein
MTPASEIEKALLMQLWTKPVNNCNHPEMADICPNCLARRAGKITDQPHSSWCAILRDVVREEQHAADYLVAI